MTKTVLLDNVEHHDLRVIVRPGGGDHVNQTLIFATEFAEAHRDYPILFRRSDNGAFHAIVLLGLDRDENLFIEGNAWQTRYVPAMLARGPFVIGMPAGDPAAGPRIHVDLDDPRISRSEGEPLFMPQGGNAPRLERIATVLRTLHLGAGTNDAVFNAFQAAGLLAPLKIHLRIDATLDYDLPDFFSVSSEALAQLDGATLEQLNRAGFLALAFHAVNSLANLNRVMELKQRRRQGLRTS